MSSEKILKVYYDGLCMLCSKETTLYKKLKGSEAIDFVDITDESFSAEIEQLNPLLVHKYMHVRLLTDQSVKTGVEAFIEIWRHLPKYSWLVPFAENIFINPFLQIGYHSFARIRKYLPKNKKACADSPYCEINR